MNKQASVVGEIKIRRAILHCALTAAALASLISCKQQTNIPTNSTDQSTQSQASAAPTQTQNSTAGEGAGKLNPPFSSNQSYEEIVRAIALEYATWRRVSDQANWAPTDCILHPPNGALKSESPDSGTHGSKLYFLFARNPDAYLNLGWQSGPTDVTFTRQVPGQAIVKEAWSPVATTQPARITDAGFSERQYPPEYAVHGEQWYRTGERQGLFIMFKVDEDRSDTDHGWVYATLDPSYERILQLGRIESCMKCHENAKCDRLFGLPRARSLLNKDLTTHR